MTVDASETKYCERSCRATLWPQYWSEESNEILYFAGEHSIVMVATADVNGE